MVFGPWGGTSSSGRGALKKDSWDVDAWPMDYIEAGLKLDDFVGGLMEGPPPRTGILAPIQVLPESLRRRALLLAV